MVEAILRLGVFGIYGCGVLLFAWAFFIADMYCSGRPIQWNPHFIRVTEMTDVTNMISSLRNMRLDETDDEAGEEYEAGGKA